MSTFPSLSENAASAVPVSPVLPAAPPTDALNVQDNGTTATAAASITPPVPHTRSQVPPQLPIDHSSNSKTSRLPPTRSRSTGTSLITQGLNIARGILHNCSQDSDRSQKQPTSAITSQPPPSVPAASQCDGDSVTPRAPPKPMASSVSVTTTAPTLASSPAIPSTYSFHDPGDALDFPRSYRDSLGQIRGRGTSLERTDKERRLQDQSHDVYSTYTNNPGDTALPHVSSQNEAGRPSYVNGEPNEESRRRYNAWRGGEQCVPIGPEKIWSIGNEEADNTQDGQVEKSIKEVLSGIEANPRSRKSAHNLRFFKESLPEDKPKRRESRVLRERPEKLHTHHEETEPVGSHREVGSSTLPSPRLTEDYQALFSSLSTLPADIPLSESPKQEYLVAQPPAAAHGASETQALEGPDAATPPISGKSPESRGDTAEGDFGDESCEEKVSSAVFVPHQTADNDTPAHPLTKNGTGQKSRTQSRAEDYHPWLVRTDQPELGSDDDSANRDHQQEQSYQLADSRRTSLYYDDYAIDDDNDQTHRLMKKGSRPPSQVFDEYVHDYHLGHRQPLEAIELVPYKHQVGGHTTIWKFSRRAVCKKLNNRENEFYETIENYHKDLLHFLPRYIGVLNVTYQKQPRRKSVVKKDEVAIQQLKNVQDSTSYGNGAESYGEAGRDAPETAGEQEHRRVISQSLQSIPASAPTVVVAENQHIIPRDFFQRALSLSLPKQINAANNRLLSHAPGERPASAEPRPKIDKPPSWGATTVNKDFRNAVFNDAFKQPVAIQKHRKGLQKAIPRKRMDSLLRSVNSDPALIRSAAAETGLNGFHPTPPEPIQHRMPKSPNIANLVSADANGDVEDVTGTSAPEPEILKDNASPSRRKRRRYSGTGLRRKPTDVSESRGNLKYFQDPDDANYKGDSEGDGPTSVFKNTPDYTSPMPVDSPPTPNETSTAGQNSVSAATTLNAGPSLDVEKIPRPPNPKEAQTRDSRNELFLLIEDLTAGMKRPCVMDLKMGTRQYGVEATPKKQKSQRRKCAETTSRELGVRICGLQVWNESTGDYLFKDKYWGRELKAGEQFQAALTMFLYNGVDKYSILRHIQTILQRLDHLYSIIRRLHGYRFYAASLLMFYDGEGTSDGFEATVDDSTTDFPTDTEEQRRRRKKNKRTIDFKIADFANSVTRKELAKDKPCPVQHPDEPDHGFLKGLRSLRVYFLKIQQDVRAELGLLPYGINGEAPRLNMEEDEATLSE